MMDNYCLYKASSGGYLELVKYLVSLNPKMLDNCEDCVRIAEKRGHVNVARFLIKCL